MPTVGWNDSTEILVGSGGGQIYFAPVGTALPATNARATAALNAAFIGAGYLDESGLSVGVGSDTFDVRVWQQRQPARRERLDQPITVRYTLVQWNETNLPFAFGGGSVVDNGSGNYTYFAPDTTAALDERSLICDAVDGAKNYRWVFPRGNVTDAVETSMNRGAASVLPVVFSIMTPADGSGSPFYLLTNDPAFAAGS